MKQDIPENAIIDLDKRKSTYSELYEVFKYLLQDDIEKQYFRRQWIKSLKKRQLDFSNQVLTIQFIEIVRGIMPLLLMYKTENIMKLISELNEELKRIDFRYLRFKVLPEEAENILYLIQACHEHFRDLDDSELFEMIGDLKGILEKFKQMNVNSSRP
jgi:hypothetical protein